MAEIGILDIIIFIAYFIFVVLIGFIAGRKKKESASDYFIASGKLENYIHFITMFNFNKTDLREVILLK